MAKKAKSAPAKSGKSGKKKGRGSTLLLTILTLAALVPFSLPTLLVLFAGMLPTIGAMLHDRRSSRYSWVCIGGFNFAGLSHWLIELWFSHHDMDSAYRTATDLRMIFVSYGAAVIGWLLFIAIPPVILAVQTGSMARRAVILSAAQKKLIETWGDELKKGLEK